MLVDVTLYRQEQAQCVIDTETETRQPGAGAPRAATAPPHPPTPSHPRPDDTPAPASFDPAVLEKCLVLVTVKTAASCWARFEHPALRHARHYLAVVKGLML